MKPQAPILLLSALAFAPAGAPASRAAEAQPLVMNLWPGKPPGHTYSKGPETGRIYQDKIVAPTRIITNVSVPTLSVYLPSKETNTGTAMVICPGGGYWNLFIELEGSQVAAWLNAHGMAGIVLKYRVPRIVHGIPPIEPLMDAQRAVSTVRSHAGEWGIDPERIGIVGFSVGGHLSMATATGFVKRMYGPIDAIDQVSCRPDFAIGCYSGYLMANEGDRIWPSLHIPPGTPPVFLAHSTDDTVADAANSAVMYLALERAGVTAELHMFASGNHDFGVLDNDKLPSSWTRLCLHWLRNLGLLKDPPRPN